MPKPMMETLKTSLEGCRRVALLGIGSELCGDDAAGMLLVRELRKLVDKGPFHFLELECFEGANAPENMTGFINSYRPTHILVVDAAEMGLATGECREIPVSGISDITFSTHTLPLKVITDYLEQATGAVITVIGMQPGSLDFDAPPSREIRAGVDKLSIDLYALLREADENL